MTNLDYLTIGQVDDKETFEINPDGLSVRVKHLNHTLEQYYFGADGFNQDISHLHT